MSIVNRSAPLSRFMLRQGLRSVTGTRCSKSMSMLNNKTTTTRRTFYQSSGPKSNSFSLGQKLSTSQMMVTTGGVITATFALYLGYNMILWSDNSERDMQLNVASGSPSVSSEVSLSTPMSSSSVSSPSSASPSVIESKQKSTPDGQKKKKSLVILGTGWGAMAVLQDIDLSEYDVTIVSPRNFFLFTPMLPSTTTGGVDYRSILDPIRSSIYRKTKGAPGVSYCEAKAVDVDYEGQRVVCKRVESRVDGSEIQGSDLDFHLDYDELVIAVGSYVNTFNTPGVEQYCHFLKEVEHAQNIRRQLWSNLERASCPGLSDQERKRLLAIAIVGGGPTGVEFAGELSDLLRHEVKKHFPNLASDLTITLIQSQDHILNTFDITMSEYAEKKFLSDKIHIITNSRVTEVKKDELVVLDKNLKKKYSIPFGVCLWSTGIKQNPLVEVISNKIGSQSINSLNCDPYLRVKGIGKRNVYAIGDCSKIDCPKMLEHCVELFEEADTNKDGVLSLSEITHMMQTKAEDYPQMKLYLTKIVEMYHQFDTNHDECLDIDEFKHFLTMADSELKSLPATAQVASQEGTYVAKELNTKARGISGDMPFRFHYRGSFANLGQHQAVAEVGSFHGGGIAAWAMYRSVYWSKQVSWRNRFSLAHDWMKTGAFGRDMSKF